MIVGKGLIATAFESTDHGKLLVFASGVSNSRSADVLAYQREKELLLSSMSAYPDLLLVYFSTYSIDDPLAAHLDYVKHKLEMENLVKQQHREYLLVRTGNITGKTGNPATLANFFHERITRGQHFECWKNAQRNLLDIEHLTKMVTRLAEEKKAPATVYLLNPVFYTAGEIVEGFEKLLGKKANCTMLEKGSAFDVDISESQRLFNTLNISSELYLENLITKYYLHAS